MSLQTFSERFTGSLDTELESISNKYPYLHGSAHEIRQSLNAYREVLNQNRDKLKAIHNNQCSGVVVCSLLSKLIDRFIVHISNPLNICEKEQDGFAVIALGGYGRSELNPFSDIDLLFLFEENTESLYQNEISTMIQFLWDINLHIGHSTRTAVECIEAAVDDTYLATSLLEARYLTGNEAIWMEFKDFYNDRFREDAGINLAMQKIKERDKRLESYHGTVQIQIPNVKESPGGLRDIHFARWLMMMTGQGNNLSELYNSGFLYEYEIPSYEEDFEFLLRVRNAMHFIAGKKSALLEHLSLPEIARNLKYTGDTTKHTEKFMREYYMRAGRVYRLTNHIVGRFLKRFETPAAHELKSDRSGLIIVDSKIGFSPDIEDSLQEHPDLLVKIFALAAAQGLDVSGPAISVIEKNLHNFDNNLPENPNVRTVFHELINTKKGVGKAFRLMHENGVLTKLIPEFGKISWHYQYDFYHAYTTDEHSIRVVENLEKMALGSLSNLHELKEIMADVTAKGALYLAGLLHDIGKSGGKAHSVRGERMAVRALERLGFDERTVDLVKFLIREHLIMSHTSQRRDMEDEDTINDFVKRVHSTGRLRMLTLLTFADLMALSDEVLTDWKKTLLLSLYNKAMIYLEKGYEELTAHSVNKIINRILRSRSKFLTKHILRDHLKQLPEQYIRVTGPGNIRAHIRGIEHLKNQVVWASFHHMNDVSLLTIITRDYPKALSDICGSITSSDINIVGAQIFTRNDGIIIDTFLVVDEHGNSLIAPETKKIFKENLRNVISGKVAVRELIKTHIHRWRRRKKKVIFSPPRIGIHNDISSRYTVIDVFAIDYTGLLYDVTSVLASFNMDIHTAKIGTDEDQVADAFYVQKSGGGKIEDEKTLNKIKGALIKTLNRTYKDKFR